MFLFLAIVSILLPVAMAVASVKAEEVSYSGDGVTMKGYLAYDDAVKGKRPGILVVHEWWGHNEYARNRARMLAGLGYTALAVDMYGDGKTADHPDDAGKFSGAISANMPGATARFQAAWNLLKKHSTVDPAQTAAIGYCFGGGIVLNMARQGLDLKGVVSFHGGLTPRLTGTPGSVKAKILVCNGAADSFTTAEEIEAFKKEMSDLKADYQFINYEGAKHSFTNPGADDFGKKFNLPLAYNAEADKKSWADMQAFFKKIFAK